MIKRLLSIFFLFSTLAMVGAGCSGGSSAAPVQQKVALKFWSVFDDETTYRDLFSAYKAAHPNVTIEYRKFRPEEYEKELIRALADGTGPDIFSVHNTKMAEFQSLLSPMPAQLNISYLVTQGTLRKETALVAKQETTISQKAYKSQFVDAVSEDAILNYSADPKVAATPRIYGFPFSMDTLALFYNKDLLNSAGIAEAPADWDLFNESVKKLTKYDATGGVAQSGAALGTVKNVDRSGDIISVLMMQNGAQMTDERGTPTFHEIPKGTPPGVFPGLDAVTFYTDFANPVKEVYTWNDGFPNSVSDFARGQTAFMLGYSYDVPILTAAAPKLNYDIAPLPQIAGGRVVNYPNYWIQGVSKTSKFGDYAWNFLDFASNPINVTKFLAKSGHPTAVRSLIGSEIDDEKIGVFAGQLLTTKSWYHGMDSDAAFKALNDLSTTILVGTDDPKKAISQTAQVVGQTY
jgi:ABC-type glycerol-3-phosphate transport system substrate-binding protein